MENRNSESVNKIVDLRRVLKDKNPAVEKIIPGFLIRYLERIIHQEELNDFLVRFSHLIDAEFIGEWLTFLQISYKVTGAENIPGQGRYIFVSNHPLGGLDGLVFIYELSKYYSGIKFPVNDILMNIKNLGGVLLPVNKHGAQGRETARKIEEAYASDNQILYFPAGLCSRKRGGTIRDLTWHKSIITKAVSHKRDIIPAFFSGRNSDFFYNLSNLRKLLGIKANIEMLYLSDEMFRQKGKNITLAFGPKIPWETFDRSKDPAGWAEWVKTKSYELDSKFPLR